MPGSLRTGGSLAPIAHSWRGTMAPTSFQRGWGAGLFASRFRAKRQHPDKNISISRSLAQALSTQKQKCQDKPGICPPLDG